MKKVAFAMVVASLSSAPAWIERFALMGTPGASYYAVTLSEDVYAHMHEATLVDLCILSGDDESMPFTIDIPYDPPPQTHALRDVHWFVTSIDDAQKPSAAGVVFGIDGVLRVSGVQLSQALVRAWLVDLSQLRDTMTALAVVLPTAGFQSGVSVQVSDDLRHWSPVAQATLFRLSN